MNTYEYNVLVPSSFVTVIVQIQNNWQWYTGVYHCQYFQFELIHCLRAFFLLQGFPLTCVFDPHTQIYVLRSTPQLPSTLTVKYGAETHAGAKVRYRKIALRIRQKVVQVLSSMFCKYYIQWEYKRIRRLHLAWSLTIIDDSDKNGLVFSLICGRLYQTIR